MPFLVKKEYNLRRAVIQNLFSAKHKEYPLCKQILYLLADNNGEDILYEVFNTLGLESTVQHDQHEVLMLLVDKLVEVKFLFKTRRSIFAPTA